ncbi:glutathione transferase GstA [Bdellovibrio bacteriovorus]|uniref:glutathione transferase GstA n=1 Tax=Bdellovibrio TaxID=958 RepID=UPI0035A8EE71
MKLYFSPGACSLAPHIVLEELGLSYDVESVDLRTKKTSAGQDYFKINPKGSVPALDLKEGGLLTECAVVLQYLCDKKPEKGLIPQVGTPERYRCLEWLNFVATDMHKGLGALFATDRMFPESPTSAQEYRTATIANMERRFAFLNSHFETNEFLMGKQYSAADAYLFTILGWANWLKVDLSKHVHVFGFMERMMGRPAVQKAMKAEGLLK